MTADARPDDVQDDESDLDRGMTVAAWAVFAALLAAVTVCWLAIFHWAGQGRMPW